MNNIIHIIQHTARTATVLLLALLTAQTAWAQILFSGGSGTQADPYKISSSADLVQLATDINNSTSRLYEDQYFVQTGNINMSGINFVPIGINDVNDHRFRGKYNGQNYTISNLTVNGSYDYAGLFGYIYNGDIDNVRLVSPSITSTKTGYTGALVGFGNMPGIHHCVVINPTLSGGNSIGVFAGGQSAGNIQYTYYTGNNNYSNVGYTIGPNANTSIGRAYTLTLASGITTSTAPAFSYGGTDYYAGTITLGAAPTGWTYAYSVNGSAISGNTFDISADASVTVTRTPIDYTITYNLGGGTNASGNPSTYTIQSQTITLAAPTREGYTFGGWYRSADLSGDAVTTIGGGQTGDVELWAKWTGNRYAISFVGNGKTGGEMDDELFTYDEAKALTACAYTRTGYHFAGWNTESDGSGTAYADGQTVQNLTAEPDATLTLYAQWTANTYSVHFEPVIPVNGTMADQTFTYDQEATALTKNAFSTTTGQWLRWNTQADGSGTNYEDEAVVQNLTAEDGGTVTLYAQWHLQHRYNYDNTIFRCYNVGTPNEVYWAYAGETVKVEVIDGTSEYTIRVVNGDGEDITLDTETNTFVMPDEEVWITYTSVKKMAYTTICLDDFESSDDVAYLYDANQPTVTPTVVVKDGETVLTEGTDYTLAITNNTGSATQMVTATVTVTGMGGYVGTNTREFRITPFNIANCEIKGMEAYDDGYGVYYPLERNVEVWNGDTKLEVGTDYSLDVESADSYVVGQFYNATVKGTGDWGGSKTFQFKVVELYHTVVFVANGGSGTMASDVATKGQHYTLPACGFTAPLGKVFDHWEVSCEEGEEKQPGNYFTAPYIWSEDDVQTITVTAYWRDAETLALTANLAPDGNYWTTYYNGTTGFKIDAEENACAYTATVSANVITLHNQGKEIPQGTAVIIVADNNEVSMTETDLAAFSGENSLHGVDVDTPLADIKATLGDGTFYVLGMTEVSGEQHFGFHRYEGTEMAARKAFVLVNGTGAALARSLTMVFDDEATGIKTTDFTDYTDSDDAWYKLDGRRLQGKPAKSGIYVNNGRKIVIK